MTYVDHPFKSPVVLSLCPGILGLERGVERAIGKIRVAVYVEIEAFIIANLVTAMESGFLDPVPIWSDVKTFNAKPFRNKLHGIIGGYPCQPFSHAGLRKGEDDPRRLWPSIRRIIDESHPAWCFFENVRGHLTLGFDVVHRELSEMGYRVEAGIFSAEEVGATHQRERLFILALANCYSSSTIGGIGDIFCPGGANEGEAQRENRQRSGNEFEYGNQAMANTANDGQRSGANQQSENGRSRKQLERTEQGCNVIDFCEDVANSNRERGQLQAERDQSTKQQSFCYNSQGSFDCWPAGQGIYQHEWEKPRAVESGLGCTVDGYNFRTDLLRAYGNAVVEQTAEHAFNTLLKKLFTNANKN